MAQAFYSALPAGTSASICHASRVAYRANPSPASNSAIATPNRTAKMAAPYRVLSMSSTYLRQLLRKQRVCFEKYSHVYRCWRERVRFSAHQDFMECIARYEVIAGCSRECPADDH
jgi:hypothetical protein